MALLFRLMVVVASGLTVIFPGRVTSSGQGNDESTFHAAAYQWEADGDTFIGYTDSYTRDLTDSTVMTDNCVRRYGKFVG